HGVPRRADGSRRRRRARGRRARDARGARAVAGGRRTPRPARRSQRRDPSRRAARPVRLRLPARPAPAAHTNPRGGGGVVGAGAGAPRSDASRRLSLRATPVARRLRREPRSARGVGPDVPPARGAVRGGRHALPGPLPLSYSTLIVPFRPSASRGDLGSRPSRLVTKAYHPGVSEHAVVYRPGGTVTARR